jgi:hypothetical protein
MFAVFHCAGDDALMLREHFPELRFHFLRHRSKAGHFASHLFSCQCGGTAEHSALLFEVRMHYLRHGLHGLASIAALSDGFAKLIVQLGIPASTCEELPSR